LEYFKARLVLSEKIGSFTGKPVGDLIIFDTVQFFTGEMTTVSTVSKN